MEKSENIINNFLKEFGKPEIEKLVEKNIAIANKIQQLLDEKDLRAADLARMLDKKPSEISKWLTGMHNFTTKTITKIETVLGEDIIYIDRQFVYFKVLVNQENEIEETCFENSQVSENQSYLDKKAS